MIKDHIKIKRFYDIVNNYFNTELIKNNSINLFEIEELNLVSDNVRMLGLSENRPTKMNWLFMEPK